MKAWLVKEKDEFSAAVVFAETRGKARSLAKRTDACADANFCDIEVRRLPDLDKYYKDGKLEMDWYIPQDRIALVKDGNFACDPWEREECERCPAKEYCDPYQDELAEMEDHHEAD